MAEPPPLSFEIDREVADYTVLRVSGEFDHSRAGELSAAVEDVFARGQKHLRIDLSDVTFFDAGAVRAIQMAARIAAEAGGSLYLVQPPSAAMRVLGIVELGHLVEASRPPPRRSTAKRRLDILSRLTTPSREDATLDRLGAVCAEVTHMTGAGIMLMAMDVPQFSVGTTNRAGELIERLQHDLGEGPCVDAYALDRPVLEPDLAAPAVMRWPMFRGPVLDAGVRAIFGFPLRIGAVRFGALNLHRDRPGPLTDDQHATALVMADVAAEVVLAVQADAPPGQLAAELAAESDSQSVVAQATGMIAVQLDTSLQNARVRLRAHAFAHDQPLIEAARQVVDRTVRFADKGPPAKQPDQIPPSS